MNKTMKQ